MAQNEVESPTVYAQNGASSERVREVFRAGACKCGCFRALTVADVVTFCQRYHALTIECHSHLLKVAYDTAGGALSGERADHVELHTDWHLCGHHVCVNALVKLLGVGRRTFYSRIAGHIDGRSISVGGSRDALQSRVVDQFFLETYHSAAEHLAEEAATEDDQLMPGLESPAATDICPAAVWSPATVMHRTDEIRRALPKRFLQHCRLTDLWWQFVAWYLSLGDVVLGNTRGVQRPVSQDSEERSRMPSWACFWRRWAALWKNVFEFRGKSQHAQCNMCWRYQQYLHKSHCSIADKRRAAQHWRQHLQEQYHDRLVYWHLRWFSQLKTKGVVTIIIDSMDKTKLAWPQYEFQKPKILNTLRRPRVIITCGIAHGYCTAFYNSDDEITSHGASAFCEVLTRLLDKVQAICSASSVPFPEHLVVQSDNTTAQAKNSETGQFLATLVGKYKFKTATLNFLTVGHTHEDVDLMFGMLLALVLRRLRFQTPEDLVTNIRLGMAAPIASRGEELVCEHMTYIRNFKAWLCPQGIHLHNAFVTRQDIQAPHSFTYKLRMDLLPVERAALTPSHVVPSASDVFCIVKHRMHHQEPNGPPVLVLPVERRDQVVPAGPDSPHLPLGGGTFSPTRTKELMTLADDLERETENWGADFSYFRAAKSLRELASPRQLDPTPAGWLENPVAPRTVPALATNNPYFGHLPDMSWPLLVQFSRQ